MDGLNAQGTIYHRRQLQGLWIAWPTAEEEEGFSVEREMDASSALIVGLVCLLGYQTWNVGVVIHNDYRYPYSGAEDVRRIPVNRWEPIIGTIMWDSLRNDYGSRGLL